MVKEKIIDYLIQSGFVQYYVKKLVYPEDQDFLYEDYLQEVWLQILEIKEEKWLQLYNQRQSQDEFYDVRNWVSILIRNTVRSTTSSAYRKLKKQTTIVDNISDDEWDYLKNTIPDDDILL